ncbi:glycosyltransferase family 4 protein [Nguyenibacter vanlangensis]|uniref:Glycosyltransferase family 4 protein n=1 Tax=Nguyenibacter vanlangensis TaxID=1216886 RepID=A0A7Y7IVF2_9PROT|nr:glycosyltransferase family 1 protein [Nguyenibacter vanlangensis]NVN11084.1 glycosyltransferase family 4 protein [Nguyenibacter vanlangensis]
MNLYINGRFLTQKISGVQRFAREISKRILEISPPGLPAHILAPPGGVACPADGLPARSCGRLRGQAWEQAELPWHARDGMLVNLGNTAPLLAPLAGQAQIVVVHDAGVFSYPQAYSAKFRLWNRGMLHALRHTRTHFVTVSEFSRRELQARLRLPDDGVSVITEGADHILSLTPDRTILARHDITPRRFVLAVGNLAPHKNLRGLSLLARSLAALDIDLVVTGGLNRTVFSESDREQSLPQPAKYIGRVDDTELRALYEAALCFVFPSFYEGFGLPPIEAMACGCPVAASAIPSLEEVCGPAAAYFDPTDPADIERRVMAVVEDPLQRGRMRDAGGIHVAGFTWDRAARQLLDIVGRRAPVASSQPLFAGQH